MSLKQKIFQIVQVVVALIIPILLLVIFAPYSLYFLLALILLLVIALLIGWLKRVISLRRNSFYVRHNRTIGYRVIYEERHGHKIRSVPLKTANYEPGLDLVVVPSREDWDKTAPEWAKGRRDEIFARVIKKEPEGWVELPSDWNRQEP